MSARATFLFGVYISCAASAFLALAGAATGEWRHIGGAAVWLVAALIFRARALLTEGGR